MATIYDVAERAGVSAATVSRFFNGQNVALDKAQRVREAADALGYSPNRTARRLRTQASEIIALVIPDIENPFFTSMARGVEDVAQASGFSVVLCNSDEDVEKETRYLEIAVNESMAGVILAAATDHAELGGLIARNRPVVAVDRVVPGFDIDAVTLDSRGGGRSATLSLLDLGYRSIACITGPRNVETSELRAVGWREALSAAQLPTPPGEYLEYADFRIDGGQAAMNALLALPEPPDAVFVANNLMSIGALRSMARYSVSPPTTGLASFGDLPFIEDKASGIVTVHLPSRHLGEMAAKLLLERIGGDTQPARTIVIRNQVGSLLPN